MTDRPALPAGMTPPGWPPPERLAAIIEAIRRRVGAYRDEFEARDRAAREGRGDAAK